MAQFSSFLGHGHQGTNSRALGAAIKRLEISATKWQGWHWRRWGVLLRWWWDRWWRGILLWWWRILRGGRWGKREKKEVGMHFHVCRISFSSNAECAICSWYFCKMLSDSYGWWWKFLCFRTGEFILNFFYIIYVFIFSVAEISSHLVTQVYHTMYMKCCLCTCFAKQIRPNFEFVLKFYLASV